MGPFTKLLAVAVTLLVPQFAGATTTSSLRREVATIALAQAKKPDPSWHPEQRDCAGLVRFAYRAAYAKWDRARLATPLWRDARGAAIPFADAETLLAENFVALGRDAETRAQSGDVLAFTTGDHGYHLMLYVRGEDRARTPALVVYSPGDGSSEVRVGELRALQHEAPAEWRPVAGNPRFLGFYRFKEWGDGEH